MIDLAYTQAVSRSGYMPAVVDPCGRLACPVCGETHGMEDGDDVYAAGPDLDAYDSPSGTRGGWIETRGFCSCCSWRYLLVVANHKGSLTIFVRGVEQR